MGNSDIRKMFFFTVGVLLAFDGLCPAVTSVIVRHSTAADLLKGQTKQTIIDSEGTIKLSRLAEGIDCNEPLADAWIINAILAGPDGEIEFD